jgi:hypothetical protein
MTDQPDNAALQHKQLHHKQLLDDAAACKVVWARVKGYPSWPSQVLPATVAAKKLGKVAHRSGAVPVMFFGTLEHAWVAEQDVLAFGDGVARGLLSKGKHKNFLLALQQVRAGDSGSLRPLALRGSAGSDGPTSVMGLGGRQLVRLATLCQLKLGPVGSKSLVHFSRWANHQVWLCRSVGLG